MNKTLASYRCEYKKKGHGMAIENTPVFIKPGTEMFESYIKRNLEDVGEIVFSRRITLNEFQLKAVYPNTEGELWSITLRRMLWKRVLVMVVRGESVIEKVVDLIGTKVDPLDCDKDSIRRYIQNFALRRNDHDLFINTLPELCSDGVTVFYPNHVHRATNTDEANVHMKALLNGDYERLMNR